MKLRAILALVSVLAPASFGAATITIVNNDGAGEGFNDPTSAAPIGGNPGTTIGQQRLNVFQEAANIFGATLTSSVVIQVRANFDPQTCTATSAVLGSAGAISIFRDSSGSILSPANHWFNEAITNKITGADNSANPDIQATFNSNIGSNGGAGAPGCGFSFYLGLDNNAPSGQISLLPVVLHELAHGLGFQTFTNGNTGALLSGFPSKFDSMLRDNTNGLLWNQMTDAQRAASARNSRNLVWTGANVNAALAGVLSSGTPTMQVTAPANLIGTYQAAAFQGAAPPYPNLTAGGLLREVMPAIPAVIITQADGALLRDFLRFRSRTSSGLFARIGLDSNFSGADSAGRAIMFAPNPFQAGSSVSHWDPIMFRNQLMEPSFSAGLTLSVLPPEDLTFRQLQDMGW